MSRLGYFWGALQRFRIVLIWTLAIGAYAAIIWVLRSSSYTADPILDTYLEMAGSLIAFTFAANALVRFRYLGGRRNRGRHFLALRSHLYDLHDL